MEQQKVEPWAASIRHGNLTEHWRVTALLAIAAKRVWDEFVDLPEEQRENLPEGLKKLIPLLYPRLELTDYFLSGVYEGERNKSCPNQSSSKTLA